MASRVKKKACVRYRHVLMSQRQIDSDLIRIRFNADWIDRGNEVRNLLQRIRILNLRNSDMLFIARALYCIAKKIDSKI